MSTNVKVLRLPHAEGLDLPRQMTAGASGADIAANQTFPRRGGHRKHRIRHRGQQQQDPAALYGFGIQIEGGVKKASQSVGPLDRYEVMAKQQLRLTPTPDNSQQFISKERLDCCPFIV